MEVPFFHLVGVDLSCQQLMYVQEIYLQVVRMGNILKRLLQQLGFGIAKQRAQCPVDSGPASFGGYQRHPDRRVFERTTKPLFAFAKQLFRPLALCDFILGLLKQP